MYGSDNTSRLAGEVDFTVTNATPARALAQIQRQAGLRGAVSAAPN
jgi:hypothetical protein